ncbi:hypothetical protein ABW19_dt0200142 [Dactylella cylindrospora]|nr:hypothetical protein ABW19_dt0200142 [Dactylella cylindrospora]
MIGSNCRGRSKDPPENIKEAQLSFILCVDRRTTQLNFPSSGSSTKRNGRAFATTRSFALRTRLMEISWATRECEGVTSTRVGGRQLGPAESIVRCPQGNKKFPHAALPEHASMQAGVARRAGVLSRREFVPRLSMHWDRLSFASKARLSLYL